MNDSEISTHQIRDLNIECIRALACVLVIVIHTSAWWGGYHSEDLSQVFITVLSHIAVPLFIMISGSFLFVKDEFSFHQVLKRFSAIFIPLVYFATIYYIADIFKGGGGANYPYYNILRFPQSSYVHLWYLYLILPIYTLSPMIKFPTLDTLWKCIVFTGTSFLVLFATDLSKNAPFQISSNYTIGWMFPFMMIGYGIKNVPWKTYNKSIKYLFIIACFLLGIATVWLIKNVPNRGYYLDVNSIIPVLMSSCVFIFMLSINFDNIKGTIWEKGVTLLSKYSLGIYGWHLLIIQLCLPYLKPTIGFVGSLIFVIVMSLLVSIMDNTLWVFVKKALKIK